MRKSRLWTLAMALAAAMGGSVASDSNDGDDIAQELSVAEFPGSEGRVPGLNGTGGEIEAGMNPQSDWNADFKV